MSNVFLTPVLVTDKATGKRVPKLDAKGNAVHHKKWRGRLYLPKGRSTTVTLTTNKLESQKRLDKLQQEQNDIASGLVPIPDKFNKALQRPIEDFFEDYFAWGKTQGGRNKKPWSAGNMLMRRQYAKFWIKELDLKVVGDLNMDIAPKIEKTMQRLLQEGTLGEKGSHNNGLSGKSVNSYRDGIYAPCAWAKKRRIIPDNPVDVTEKVSEEPTVIRRYEPLDVWERILEASEPYLRMVLETALGTGFRVNELRSLTPDHLYPGVNKIGLSADMDKARTERMQPVTAELMNKLTAYAESGEAKALYKRYPARGNLRHQVPENPLLFVPNHIARIFNRALKEAGIPKNTKDGKLDVHSARTAYITNVYRSNVDIQTTLSLCRHTTLNTALYHYVRDSDVILHATVATVFDRKERSGHPTCVQQRKMSASQKGTTSDNIGGCDDVILVGETGFEPAASSSRTKRATKLRHSP